METSTRPSGSGLATKSKDKSKQEIIKEALLAGSILSAYTANQIAHTVNGSKLISNLRCEGLPIRDTWQQSERGENYKIYWIDQEYVRKAGASL